MSSHTAGARSRNVSMALSGRTSPQIVGLLARSSTERGVEKLRDANLQRGTREGRQILEHKGKQCIGAVQRLEEKVQGVRHEHIVLRAL